MSGPWGARFDHVTIITARRAEARDLFTSVLAAEVLRHDERTKSSDQVLVTQLSFAGTGLSLLEPVDPDGPLGRLLARRGPGLHHIAWRLDQLNEAITAIEGRGIGLRPYGADGVALNVKDAFGVLLWLRPGDKPSEYTSRASTVSVPSSPERAYLHHATIAHDRREEALAFFQSILGGRREEPKRYGHMWGQELTMDGPQLGFISPETPDSFVRSFIDSRGAGLHHIAFKVPDMVAAVTTARDRGIRFIESRPPATIYDDVFIHPSNPTGALIRLGKAEEGRVKSEE